MKPLSANLLSDLAEVHRAIVACERCPRLRRYHCRRVATEKKRAHRYDAYWGLPVPGFGDPKRDCCWSGLHRPRMEQIGRVESSPETALVIS